MKVDDEVVEADIRSLRQRGVDCCEDLKALLDKMVAGFGDQESHPWVDASVAYMTMRTLLTVAAELRILLNLRRRGGES